MKSSSAIVVMLWSLITSGGALAAEVRVAVAANFLGTLQTLASTYEARTGHPIAISSGSSGALYAQISNGAPFDVFFSADIARAQALVDNGLAVADSRYTYALGVPVLWSSQSDYLSDPEARLRNGRYRFLSIPDPRNAPYGVASQQILTQVGVWDTLNQAGRLVRAQTITQVYTQVASGAAELGFVALAQVQAEDGTIPGSYWIPPPEWFDPIEQQVVLLKRASDSEVAQDFIAWVRGDEARQLIEAAGYRTP